MNRKVLSVFILMIGFVLLLFAPSTLSLVLAQEPDYDQINEVARYLNCPTCQGINLADCRTQTCAQWKEQIGDLLQEGYSNQEVLDHFVTQYGQQVLQEPPRSGATLWLWIIPFLLLLAGGVWMLRTMRIWTQPSPVTVGETMPPAKAGNSASAGQLTEDDYLRQVEEDLKS